MKTKNLKKIFFIKTNIDYVIKLCNETNITTDEVSIKLNKILQDLEELINK